MRYSGRMKRISALAVAGGALLLVAGLGYLGFKPVPINAVAWDGKPSPGYSGAHAPNTRLADLKLINTGKESGPEHLVVRLENGVQKLYAAFESGRIVRMNLDGTNQEVAARTGGRVLGFDFDSQGRLIAADAMLGLVAIGPDQTVNVLASVLTDGDKRASPIRYADAVVVARSGKIYFTDASQRFGPAQFGGTFEASVLDILEQSSTGRVIEYDPSSSQARVVATGFSFANGIALSADEQHVFVAETGKYRIWKLAVGANNLQVNSGQTSPLASVLIDNLPGYPDNLMRGLPTAQGTPKLWVGLVKPRTAVVDSMAGKPWLREVTLRLPRALWPIPKPYGHVFAFDESGKVLEDLQDPSGAYPETTSVTELPDRLLLQSLHAKSIGWLPRTPTGAAPANLAKP